MSQIVAKVADAVAVHMGDSASPAVRTTTCKLLMELANLDSDAVWLLLFRLQVKTQDLAMASCCHGAILNLGLHV